MANDREVLRIIWEGQIPICFQADIDEANAVRQPENFYLMVSRLSYLQLVTDKVKKHFSRYVSNDAQEGEVWFDSNGTPLKWHFPIGVLFELTKRDDELPWCITIHFSKFPDEILFRCPNREIVESHFMSCLKEADVLKHRGQVVSRMQKKDHNQLWLGLVNDKFDQFWSVNRRLMEPTSEEGFKYIPIRCYKEDGTYIQKLVPPNSDNGSKRTVHNLLEDFSTPARKAGKNAVTSVGALNLHNILGIGPRDPGSSLNQALLSGREAEAIELLRNGARTDTLTRDGFLPLHLATQQGFTNIVLAILFTNRNYVNQIDLKTNFGMTPLYLAAKEGHGDIVDILLENRANISVTDNEGRTPLHGAARGGVHEGGQANAAEKLISNGAHLHVKDNDGKTPLHLAAEEGNMDVVEVLLEHGAKKNKKDNDERTPLHLAALRGHENVVDLLLKNDASKTRKDKDGKTAKDLARRKGHTAVVDLLS